MTAHNTPQEALLQELSVTAEAGLSSQEAQRRLAEYGENKLAEKKKKTNFQRFLEAVSGCDDPHPAAGGGGKLCGGLLWP